MAQTNLGAIAANPGYVTKVRVDSVTSGTGINVKYNYDSGKSLPVPDYYIVNTFTRAGTPCAYVVSRVPASDSTTNQTINLVWDTETGGSLTSAVFDVYFFFNGTSAGGVG